LVLPLVLAASPLEEARILERNENSATPFLKFFAKTRSAEQITNKT